MQPVNILRILTFSVLRGLGTRLWDALYIGGLHKNEICFSNTILNLRWLNTVFKKMENSRFRCVFFDNYYLLINKKYLTYENKI
jgi:hypothetical protein